ncbi:hypothetical protein EPVG_00200 [Emiliania huxleyi virus 201]|nr:hypothetical protein ELVG_00101 [Emiliania huxleyi virus 203]AEP15508.1 hypothetical protein EQVG_00098 [Emiliania huxleyi virus 207]AEP15931.1 hypothetical protein ERVG_00053 [Emiliania huxleyi virus 208]AET98087.1 hypothetical protein EPVG_00200 [Emiliania huxleyi virus 201]
MAPPTRRYQDINPPATGVDANGNRINITQVQAGGATTYLVQRRSMMELFYVGIYTGSAFSVIFIISDSIPIFVDEFTPDDWNPAAIRGIAVAMWIVINLAFVILLSRIIPLND